MKNPVTQENGYRKLKKSPQPQIRARGRNELHLGVDTSFDAADVGVCATTSDAEAQHPSSEGKATTAFVAQVPRAAVSVLLSTPVSDPPTRTDPVLRQSYFHHGLSDPRRSP